MSSADPQAVGDHGVGAPGGGEFGDEAAAVAHARAFDDDAGHDRPGVRADPVLGFPQFVAGVEGGFGLRQAGAGSEAGRAQPVGRDGAQLIEPGALMGAAQRFADQPADVVELRIVRREHPVGAHGVERIEKAARPVGVEGRRLPASLARARRSGVASSRSWTALSISCGDWRALGRLAGAAHSAGLRSIGPPSSAEFQPPAPRRSDPAPRVPRTGPRARCNRTAR